MPVDVSHQLFDFLSARRVFACMVIATEEEVGS